MTAVKFDVTSVKQLKVSAVKLANSSKVYSCSEVKSKLALIALGIGKSFCRVSLVIKITPVHCSSEFVDQRGMLSADP